MQYLMRSNQYGKIDLKIVYEKGSLSMVGVEIPKIT